jgi:hypothetical protein
MTRPLVFAGFLVAVGCSSPAEESSVQVDAVTFSPGCGVKQEPDCSFGFVMTYVMNRANVEVSHVTDNDAHTLDITVSSEGSGDGTKGSFANANLGLLDVKVGQTYSVTVLDTKHTVLWSGKVDTLYHL